MKYIISQRWAESTRLYRGKIAILIPIEGSEHLRILAVNNPVIFSEFGVNGEIPLPTGNAFCARVKLRPTTHAAFLRIALQNEFAQTSDSDEQAKNTMPRG